jgi:hypothetical protein
MSTLSAGRRQLGEVHQQKWRDDREERTEKREEVENRI